MITYSNIENEEAISFLRKYNAHKEHIAVGDCEFWIGAKENNHVVGVIGLIFVGRNVRVKNFYVQKGYRNNGIGKELLSKIIINNKKMTTFATELSRPLFEKYGFIVKSKNKNGIYFVEREASNV